MSLPKLTYSLPRTLGLDPENRIKLISALTEVQYSHGTDYSAWQTCKLIRHLLDQDQAMRHYYINPIASEAQSVPYSINSRASAISRNIRKAIVAKEVYSKYLLMMYEPVPEYI